MAQPVLSHERIATTTPERWLYILHGIYGAGRNWASVARRITRERPDWGAVLVDLRQHGSSKGFPPPHTLVAAAEDLVELGRGTGEVPAAVLGHSFGGKVALAYARRAPEQLRQLWIVDASPDAREPAGSAWDMLRVLRELPDRFESRDAAIAALESRGVARPTAQWMGTNIERKEDASYGWRFDLDDMEALLLDFFQADLWPVVERPPGDFDIHFVKAEESSIIGERTAARIEAAPPSVRLHRVAGGHWVNADNPDALIELLVRELPDSG